MLLIHVELGWIVLDSASVFGSSCKHYSRNCVFLVACFNITYSLTGGSWKSIGPLSRATFALFNHSPSELPSSFRFSFLSAVSKIKQSQPPTSGKICVEKGIARDWKDRSRQQKGATTRESEEAITDDKRRKETPMVSTKSEHRAPPW
jgi:hypothetical protein